MRHRVRWLGFVVYLSACRGVAHTASVWDMIPREESVERATDGFKQAWRVQAGQQFSEPGRVAANHHISAILLTIFVVVICTRFLLMVKNNRIQQTAKRMRSDMPVFYTGVGLISRWGYRHRPPAKRTLI